MNTTLLEQHLVYRFTDTGLLAKALRHSSYVNEQADPAMEDNERLEFLGDAALSLCIGHLLMARFPELSEGDLSQTRAGLVNAGWLADIGRSMNLGEYVLLGKGEEQTNGRNKDSILANAVEALLGAIYLDGGFDAVMAVVRHKFENDIEALAALDMNRNYKSLLQELTQATDGKAPTYEIIDETGPDHDKTFHCRVSAGDIQAEGSGKNKKTAQQDAAHKALALIKGEPLP
ncbi:ribonuclease III [Desulfosudis oleivorans]|uniref:Ribonuclease 3 n=1 Tax=Desulfosudis oleivorans (strain DSM 6200 / JCM 39069 / Hxd3) TaxID=96561 RepID=A8ZZF3_DESOH|nr:ribonuclease III [Desulfosudis oleivorans]ABW67306.1 Ribonuclease III [Desulfosudis oleivorans Hxd3]